MRKLVLATTLALALAPLPALAQAPQDGRPLAEYWCMGCHVVEREPNRGPRERVPSFSAIASKPGMTRERIAAHLSTGHTHMPDFRLSPWERDALIAYILSQKD